jgi:hypothetical protein
MLNSTLGFQSSIGKRNSNPVRKACPYSENYLNQFDEA